MLLSASSFAVQNRHLLTSLRAASPRDPANAAPQYLACGSRSAARHIRAQTRRSLNECALVRLASQAVPSPNPVGFYHCGAAIGSLITKVGLVPYFYFAKVRETGLLLSV